MKTVTEKEWQMILEQSPTNNDLRYIMRYTSKAEEAWAQLLKQSPTNEDLRYIMRYTSKAEEAQRILDKRAKNKSMIDIIKER